jgi:hypothetical protein
MLSALANLHEAPMRLSARQFGATAELSLDGGPASGYVRVTAHLPRTTTGFILFRSPVA